MQRIADLATRHKVTVPGVRLSSMQNDLKLGQALLPSKPSSNAPCSLCRIPGLQADTEAWRRSWRFMVSCPRWRTATATSKAGSFL